MQKPNMVADLVRRIFVLTLCSFRNKFKRFINCQKKIKYKFMVYHGLNYFNRCIALLLLLTIWPANEFVYSFQSGTNIGNSDKSGGGKGDKESGNGGSKNDSEKGGKESGSGNSKSDGGNSMTSAGKDTTDNNFSMEVEVLSYKALSDVATKIANEIATEVGKAETDDSLAEPNESKPTINFLVYNQITLNSLFTYKVFQRQLTLVNDNYRAVIGKAKTDSKKFDDREDECLKKLQGSEVLAITAAEVTDTTKTIIGLLNLFKTDITVQGKEVKIEDKVFVSEMARTLKAAYDKKKIGIKFYNPNLFPINTENIEVRKSELIEGLLDLYSQKSKADTLITELKNDRQRYKTLVENLAKDEREIEEATKALDIAKEQLSLSTSSSEKETPSVIKLLTKKKSTTPKNESSKTSDEQRQKLIEKAEMDLKDKKAKRDKDEECLEIFKGDQLDEVLAQDIDDLNSVNSQFTALTSGLSQVDQETNVTLLTTLMKSYYLSQFISSNNSNIYWLDLSVNKAGGNNRISTNVFRAIIGPGFSESGGVIVNYNLYDSSGAVIKSGRVSSYHKYVKSKKVHDIADE